MRKIASKLMSYNKKQVNEYLEQIRKIQEDELSSISENIEIYRQERDALVRELNMLHEEKSKYIKSNELLDIALERVNKIVDLIDSAAIEDIQIIEEESKQRVIIHGNYFVDVENEIKKTRMKIDLNLKEIFKVIKEKEDAGRAEEDLSVRKVVGTILPTASKSDSIISALGSSMISANEDIAGKMVVTINGSLVGHVGNVVINKSTKEIEGFYLTSEQFNGGKFIHSDLVIAVKNNSLVVSANWQKESVWIGKTDGRGKIIEEKLESLESQIEEKMTADGAIVPRSNIVAGPVDNPADTTAYTDNIIKNALSLNRADSSAESQHVAAEGVGESLGGFWNTGFDSAWESDFPLEENTKTSDEQIVVPENVAQELFLAEAEMTSSIDEELVSGEQDSALVGESPPVSTIGEEPAQNERVKKQLKTHKASTAVEKEINAVRHKYIVGKLAGEDLLENSGQIIIHKNELITPEIVELAEKEGKLPELIIHMVIPGLEE